jgi:hypothetical protein
MASVVKRANPGCKHIDDISISPDNPLDQDESRVIETITLPRWQLFDLSHTAHIPHNLYHPPLILQRQEGVAWHDPSTEALTASTVLIWGPTHSCRPGGARSCSPEGARDRGLFEDILCRPQRQMNCNTLGRFLVGLASLRTKTCDTIPLHRIPCMHRTDCDSISVACLCNIDRQVSPVASARRKASSSGS